MEEQVEAYDLQYQDYQPYEVLCTKWISYDEILALKKVEEMVEVYYNSDQFAHTIPYLLSFYPSAFSFYAALGDYYEANDLFGIGFKREARYEALRQFAIADPTITDLSMTVLDDLLTYDYYLRENAKSRPAWRPEEPIDKIVYQQFFKNAGTDEVWLMKEGYDSKVAARTMHIEPVSSKSVAWILAEGTSDYLQSADAVDTNEDKTCYCLFDYGKRNPLSKDAGVKILTHL